jgi:PilZ domain
MEDVAAREKRAIRRFALDLPVTVTARSGESLQATAETRDVSSHGICFYCDSAMVRDSAIEFTLTLPKEVTMTEPVSVHCRGRVVRVDGNAGNGKFAIAAAIDSYELVSDDETQYESPSYHRPPSL